MAPEFKEGGVSPARVQPEEQAQPEMPHAVAGQFMPGPEGPLTGVEQAEDEREQQGSCRDFPQAEDRGQDGDGHQAHRDKWRPHDEWPFWVARTRLPRTDRALPVCRSTSGASSELMRLTFGVDRGQRAVLFLDQLQETRGLAAVAVLALLANRCVRALAVWVVIDAQAQRAYRWLLVVLLVVRPSARRATAVRQRDDGAQQSGQGKISSVTGGVMCRDLSARRPGATGHSSSTHPRKPDSVDAGARTRRRPHSAMPLTIASGVVSSSARASPSSRFRASVHARITPMAVSLASA